MLDLPEQAIPARARKVPMRVPQYLTDHHVAFETLCIHQPTPRKKRAHFLHIRAGKWPRAFSWRVPKDMFWRCCRLPIRSILMRSLTLGGRSPSGRRGNRRPLRDCEWGALAPFGTLYGITTTLLDESLNADTLMVFESQRHALAIRMRCGDYEALEHPRRFCFARATTARKPRHEEHE